ncbi:MAG: MerR family transcriptional regulator [Sphingomicrobium sp.]
MAAGDKDPDALKTIGELSLELGVAQHILRYWETRFPELKPMQRAGNRRYYRPADVALARRINRLLGEEGYTVRGVQKLLRGKSGEDSAPSPASTPAPAPAAAAVQQPPSPNQPTIDVSRLIEIRDRLAALIDG